MSDSTSMQYKRNFYSKILQRWRPGMNMVYPIFPSKYSTLYTGQLDGFMLNFGQLSTSGLTVKMYNCMQLIDAPSPNQSTSGIQYNQLSTSETFVMMPAKTWLIHVYKQNNIIMIDFKYSLIGGSYDLANKGGFLYSNTYNYGQQLITTERIPVSIELKSKLGDVNDQSKQGWLTRGELSIGGQVLNKDIVKQYAIVGMTCPALQ